MQVLLSPPFSFLILGRLKFPQKYTFPCFEMPLCRYVPANKFSDLRFRDISEGTGKLLYFALFPVFYFFCFT